MSGKIYLNNNQFFKPNYNQAIDYIIPKFIDNDERELYGTADDITDLVINSHIDVASSMNSLLPVSAITGSFYSAINTLEGIAPYFIKQNNLSKITPKSFELNILNRVGQSLSNFQTSSDFAIYLDETLLPSIRRNVLQNYFLQGESASAVHIGLIEDISWLYFLNSSGTQYNPSSFVKEVLIDKTYNGQPIELVDCMKGLSEYLWKNNLSAYFPSIFYSGTETYTSGTQQLNKLKTWIDIIYSPLHADRSDFTVRDRFQIFIENQLKTTNRISDGPIHKLIKMLSFAAFDINNDTEIIKSLYDIEDCPDKYLPFMANLIGWNLFGSNADRWRLQLQNAVDIYKKVGTKSSLQFALNSVFPKDIFNIESRITELWESYVPYLIYYSLATESDYFRSNETWTPQIATNMNVESYCFSSIDENVKLATDRIILETYTQFSASFNIPNKDNKFYYRNREYSIPPFEEYPYYVNTELTIDMINFISDRLACFGVRKDFVLQFRDYVIENTLEVDEEIRSSSWLFFTSGYNDPPNLDNLVINLNSKNFDYASLWSGKSSHFKLLFDASEFDFTSIDDASEDSGDAIIIASKIINEFSPAHAIPLINLRLSSVDTVDFDYDELPIISLSPIETPEYFQPCLNIESSGYSFGKYKRGNNGQPLKKITSLSDTVLKDTTITTNIIRTSQRRRSYEKLMPFYGYYDRTGFNPPVSWDPSASLSGLPLGFVPSSLSFCSITDYSNIPDIYSICHDVNSSASFFGFNVSNALRTRGHIELGTRDYYCDRGQLPEIYAIIHEIAEAKKILQASALGGSSLLDWTWKHVDISLANSATETSGWFPNEVEDFYNFRFGKDLHKLYQYYTKNFSRHRLSEDLHYSDGPNIFSHTFGPIFYNSDFKIGGPLAESYTVTSVSSTIEWQAGNSGALSFVASAASSMYIDKFEFVNSSILSGIELIHSSGASLGNSFSVIRLAGSEKPATADEYLFENGFIKCKSIDGLSRIRFDLRKYNCGDPIGTNFLLPDSQYKFNFKSIVSNGAFNYFGGRSVGVWVHTKPESGFMWSYKDGNWMMHPQLVTKSDLYSKYINIFNFEVDDRRANNPTSDNDLRLTCITIENEDPELVEPILLLKKEDLITKEFTFNTCNFNLEVSENYFKNHGQVHRINQNYIIEIFLLPDSQTPNSFLLLDNVSLQNLTLKRLSEILAVDGCPEYRIELTKEQLQYIFMFWNDITRLKATRVDLDGNGYVGGGSRLDYRTDKDWNGRYTGVATTKYFGEGAQNVILQNLYFNI